MPDQTPSAEPIKPSWAPMIWGVLAVLGLAALFLAGASLYLAKVRESERRARCRSNLRVLVLACKLYSDDYNGWMPDGLEKLFPDCLDEVRDAHRLVCPSAMNLLKDTPGSDRQRNPGPAYVYVSGLNNYWPADLIICYEKLENHRGAGRNMVFLDGHTEWWPASHEAEFQSTLAAQRGAVEQWRKSGKPGESFGEFYKPHELRREFYSPPWEGKE